MDKGLKKAYFQIKGGGIPEYAFFEENYDDSVKQFQLHSSLGFTFNADSNVLNCLCGVKIMQENLPILKSSVSFDYAIAEETIASLRKSKKLIFPKSLLTYFGTNALGALRGVIMAKLETSQFKFILPPVNLNDIIEDDLTIEIK